MSEQTRPLSTWEQDSSFLPEDYVRSKGEKRANLLSLSLFGVMMFAVVAAFFATNKRWMNVRDEKQTINAQYVREAGKIDELKALEQQRDELIKKAEVTAALVERVPRSLLFAQIVRRMPEDVKLLEMELVSEEIKRAAPAKNKGKSAGVRTLSGSGGTTSRGAKKDDEDDGPLVPQYRQALTLVGVGLKNDDIADYIEELRDCAILSHIELQYIKQVKIEGIELRKFELLARVRSDVDARGLSEAEAEVLPEVLDPGDLTPSVPVFVPPSQFDDEGNPLRSRQREGNGLGSFGFLGSTFDKLKDLGASTREEDASDGEPAASAETEPVSEVVPAPEPVEEAPAPSDPVEEAPPADPEGEAPKSAQELLAEAAADTQGDGTGGEQDESESESDSDSEEEAEDEDGEEDDEDEDKGEG